MERAPIKLGGCPPSCFKTFVAHSCSDSIVFPCFLSRASLMLIHCTPSPCSCFSRSEISNRRSILSLHLFPFHLHPSNTKKALPLFVSHHVDLHTTHVLLGQVEAVPCRLSFKREEQKSSSVSLHRQIERFSIERWQREEVKRERKRRSEDCNVASGKSPSRKRSA